MTEKPSAAAKGREQSRFRIDVTEKDIQRAKRNDSYVCVVSQAIARAIPDATRIDTDIQSIRFTRHGRRYVFLTPYAVQGYVVAFDAGEAIQPFSFQLRNPMKAQQKHLTDVGRTIARLRVRGRTQAKKKAIKAGKSLEAPETQAELRRAATAAYKEAAQAHPGPRSSTEPGRRTPRVFKRKTRNYGHRLLRINQPSSEAVESTSLVEN
jgi:hypothetical protein